MRQLIRRAIAKNHPWSHHATFVTKAQRTIAKESQGPSERNLAHQHADYIFHSFLGLPYKTTAAKQHLYEPQCDSNGAPLPFRMKMNQDKMVIASCPNGKTYSLSSALAHANLNYYKLLDNPDDKKVLKRCLTKLDKKYVKFDRKLRQRHKKSSSRLSIDLLEWYAIERYTADSFHSFMNTLLQGKAFASQINVSKYFIFSMLAISGANKNVRSKPRRKDTEIKRYERFRSHAFESKLRSGEVVFFNGLNSFTEKDHLNNSYMRKRINRLNIRGDMVPQSNISDISFVEHEDEVLLGPTYAKVTAHTATEDGKQHYHLQPISGVATESIDEYSIQYALLLLANAMDLAHTDELVTIGYNDDSPRPAARPTTEMNLLDQTLVEIISLYSINARLMDYEAVSETFIEFLNDTMSLNDYDISFYTDVFHCTHGETNSALTLTTREQARHSALLRAALAASNDTGLTVATLQEVFNERQQGAKSIS